MLAHQIYSCQPLLCVLKFVLECLIKPRVFPCTYPNGTLKCLILDKTVEVRKERKGDGEMGRGEGQRGEAGREAGRKKWRKKREREPCRQPPNSELSSDEARAPDIH